MAILTTAIRRGFTLYEYILVNDDDDGFRWHACLSVNYFLSHCNFVKLTRSIFGIIYCAITLFRSNVKACKSKVRFPPGCNQSVGVPIANAGLSHGVDQRQNALYDHKDHKENTEDHRSWRSVISHGNTCYWSDLLFYLLQFASSYDDNHKILTFLVLTLWHDAFHGFTQLTYWLHPPHHFYLL